MRIRKNKNLHDEKDYSFNAFKYPATAAIVNFVVKSTFTFEIFCFTFVSIG